MVVLDPLGAGEGYGSIRQKFYTDANSLPLFWIFPQHYELIESCEELIDGELIHEVGLQNPRIRITDMVQCLLFYLLLNSGGAFLLLFLLDGEIHAQKWIDAFGRLGFFVDEANAGLRRSVQQSMQYFREVVPDRYEVVERNDLRIQSINSHDSLFYVIWSYLIVIQLLVALLE